MSETTGATHTDPLDGWKFGSIGKPVPNTECKVKVFFFSKYIYLVPSLVGYHSF